MAQFGSALDWGSRGRGFKSRQPDLLVASITYGATSRWNHAVRLAPATAPRFSRAVPREAPGALRGHPRSLVALWTLTARGCHNGGDSPGCSRMGPRGRRLEPPAEGIHKDTDGPDQASDRVDQLAHLPGRSPVLADLGVTALGLGHGPHLLPGSSPPRQGQRVIRGEVPEKARQAYGMGCGGVDTIPTQRRGSSAWARMMSGGRPRRWATSATERQWTVTSGGGGRDGPSHGADDQGADPAGPGDYGEPDVDPGRGPGHGDGAGFS